MDRSIKILVPRLMDATNWNAQNQNAQALLSRFRRLDCVWVTTAYDEPSERARTGPRTRIVRLWRGRMYPVHVACLYQLNFDAIFYPGIQWFDDFALRFRDLTGRRIPIIATAEGVPGDDQCERALTEFIGHVVICGRADVAQLKRFDRLFRADHVIAISPFLARVFNRVYGCQTSVLPCGVDRSLFYSVPRSLNTGRKRVCAAGAVTVPKRPEVFLRLAAENPMCDFIWFGAGPLREKLIAEVATRRLTNLVFPGMVSPRTLADSLRTCDVFVLPSHSEGVPKVTQEAAACGVPCIIFGFYESPSVIDGKTGFVVWTDEELSTKLANLLQDEDLRRSMGRQAETLAKGWDWEILAPRWEETIVGLIRRSRQAGDRCRGR